MRCPKCGFVNFPGLRECKKCGRELATGADDSRPEGSPANMRERPVSPSSPAPRERFSGQRFDFDTAARADSKPGATTGGTGQVKANTANFLDRAFDRSASGVNLPDFESVPLNRPPVKTPQSRQERIGGNFIESSRRQPLGIELPSGPLRTFESGGDEASAAPLGRRFLSGVVDGLILLVAAALFCGLFIAIGGRIERYPLGSAIAALIALFWIFFYFGFFTAFALHTPGQSAMDLTVRNLDGGLPTPQEALLRAFGYLISILALMVGFLWAAMDSDGLAWHDHISGTLLVEDEQSQHGG